MFLIYWGVSTSIANESFTFESERGVYKVVLTSQTDTVPIAELHNWELEVSTPQGTRFFPNQLVIEGGMPGHGHGFPVEPQITQYLESNKFLVEGVLFNMAGEWQLRVGIDGPWGWDTATVTLNIAPQTSQKSAQEWSDSELAQLKNLSWKNAGPVPDDPSNRFGENTSAIELGRALFFDPKLSRDKRVSCASCHQPEKAFGDGLNKSFGSRETQRHAPSLLGVARHRWFYWDGRRDSLWAQAVTPIETSGEMDNNRMDAVRYFLSEPTYLSSYQKLVGVAPDLSDEKRFPTGAGPYANRSGKSKWEKMSRADRHSVNAVFIVIGKVLAAFESTLDFQESRFDRYVNQLAESGQRGQHAQISESEKRGIRLFLNQEKTQCLRCHNGPLFSNKGFHNIGTGVFQGAGLDFGRFYGLQSARLDTFNCEGRYSDASPDQCTALRFSLKKEIPAFMQGAFKVPTLRNVSHSAPFFHDGRFASLREVVEHYRQPPGQNSELQSLDLTDQDVSDLIAFLNLLSDVTEH